MPYVPSLATTPGTTSKNSFVGYIKRSANLPTPIEAKASLAIITSGTGFSRLKRRGLLSNGHSVLYGFVPTNYRLDSYNYRFTMGSGVVKTSTGRYYAYEVLPTAGIAGGGGYMVGHALDCYNPYVGHLHNLPAVAVARNALKRVETKAIVKARRASIDMSENLAGLGQTASMLAQIVKSLASSLLALRRGNLPEAFAGLKDVALGSSVATGGKKHGVRVVLRGKHSYSDAYLRYIYGIAPLLNDIRTLMDRATDYVERLSVDKPVSFSAYVRDELPRFTSSGFSKAAYSKYSATCHTTCSLTYALDPHQTSYLRALAREYSFDNPFYFIWVSTPWSFVIDWFLPVANFLQALSGVYGYTFLYGYTTQCVHASMHERADTFLAASSTDITVESKPAEWNGEAVFMQRTRIYTPTSRLYLQNPFNTNRLAASTALAIASVRR